MSPEVLVRDEESGANLQHISEREPDDQDSDPSTHPSTGPLFMQRSRSDVRSKLIQIKISAISNRIREVVSIVNYYLTVY